MTGPASEQCRFRIESDVLPDVLARLLGPFAVQGATLATVCHVLAGSGTKTQIEALGLDPSRAELLRQRIAQMPWVRSVSLTLGPVDAPGPLRVCA